VSRQVSVSADRVFTILSDGWLIPVWLVGAAHIRDVDAGWPAVDTQLHHSIGAWPLLISDTTQVVEVEPARRLRMHARMWPLGEALVELRMESQGAGSEIVMAEAPAGGPALWLDNPLERFYLRRRNIESLARLAALVENRID
jgi:hypothetical protein